MTSPRSISRLEKIRLGGTEQWIRILGKRIHKLHIKEYSRKKRDEAGYKKGWAVEYLEGDNDWPSVMKALDEIGYSGWAVAEPAWRPDMSAQPFVDPWQFSIRRIRSSLFTGCIR